MQFGNALGRVSFAAFAHLLEQVKQRKQARFRADELPLAELCQPGNGLFGSGRQIELRLVCAGAVELAQPALVGRGPIVQVLKRWFRKGAFTRVQAQGIQLVLQCFGQIRRCHHPHIRHYENPLQKTRYQRCMIRTQQPPRGVVGAQSIEGGVVECHAALSSVVLKVPKDIAPSLSASPLVFAGGMVVAFWAPAVITISD